MLGPFGSPMMAAEGPFVEAGGGMYAGAEINFDMERWFEDYEWSVCWDFEMKSWGHPSKGGATAWQQQQRSPWAMKDKPSGSWAGGGPPGPPPGPPPGGPWFAEPTSKGSWGPSALDGPYIGDANSGEKEEESWGGGYKSWNSGSKTWGRGRGGKGWSEGDAETEESWQSSSWWAQDGWSSAGRGRGKGSGKKGDAEDKAWPSEGWGSTGGSKSSKGGGKDSKGSFEESKGKGKSKKGNATAPAWQARDSGEADSGRPGDAAKDDVVAEIDSLLAEAKSNLEKGDFDFRVRRFLFALRTSGGRQKVRDALAMIQTYTQQKSRQSVKNWPAYLLTLLKKFEPEPFAKAKSKAKDRGVDREQDRGEMRAPAAASSKKAVQPVAATAGMGVQQGEEDGDIEVVRADEEERSPNDRPVPSTDAPRPSFDVTLPPGWEDGRSVLHEEISSALSSNSAGKEALRCPFTSQPLDIEAVLISQVAASLREAAASNASKQLAAHHLAGLARSRCVVDCPRAAVATALVHCEHALPDDASAMDAVIAYSKAGEASAATTVLQEIALELTAEVLRNPQLGNSANP